MKLYAVMEIRGKDCVFPHLKTFSTTKDEAETIAALMQRDSDKRDFSNKPKDGIFFRVAKFEDYPVSRDFIKEINLYNKRFSQS